MRVCNQFTDERVARFFPPLNHELEVHETVDISNVPSVVGLSIEQPIVVVGAKDKDPTGENPLTLTDGVALAQGEKVLGLQSYKSVREGAEHAPRYLYPEAMEAFGDNLGVSPESLDGLTHAVVEYDWMLGPRGARKMLEDTPFAESDAIILPIGESLPHISQEFVDSRAFIVKGFVNSNGEMVKWQTKRTIGKSLVDMCVMHAFTANRVELQLLRYAIGHEATLLGLVSVNRSVEAYLKSFDEIALSRRQGMTFTPTSEPTYSGYARRFPQLGSRDRAKLEKLMDVSFRAMTTPDRSQLT